MVRLYTHIPQGSGITAGLYPGDKYTSEVINDALEIIMANNACLYDDKHFKQLIGIRSGTNLAIAFLEENCFARIGEIYDNVTVSTIQTNWMRYLDD